MSEHDVRLQQLQTWLAEQLPSLFAAREWGAVPEAELTPASSDASFRRYFRWQAGERSLILMDAPPPQENCEPFVRIAALLASAGVHFAQWQANAPVSADSSAGQITAAYAADIARLQAEGGYITVDVISLSASHPDKQALRQKFLAEHTHSEDEVRFFVRGQGLFCLHIGGRVYQVLCQQNDLISVPAGTTHWFSMRGSLQRLFSRLAWLTGGWPSWPGRSTSNRLAPVMDRPWPRPM